MTKPKRSMTLAEYRDWLRSEGKYDELMEKKRKQEQERLERSHKLREAEKPIVEELRAAGYDVKGVRDLIRMKSSYASALPILMEHIRRPYPKDVRVNLAWALRAPEARAHWPFLVEQFRAEQTGSVKDFLAGTLAEISTDALLDDIIRLARDTTQGSSRLLLLSALDRTRDPRGLATLEGLASDPDLKVEIADILRKRKKRKRHSKPAKTTPAPSNTARPEAELEELSMSFDLEDVPAFLEAIADRIGPSLPTATVREIIDTIEGMDVEEELSWALEVDFEGRSVPLQVAAFMDDTDAPDLFLFTVPDLARRLEPILEEHMK